MTLVLCHKWFDDLTLLKMYIIQQIFVCHLFMKYLISVQENDNLSILLQIIVCIYLPLGGP